MKKSTKVFISIILIGCLAAGIGLGVNYGLLQNQTQNEQQYNPDNDNQGNQEENNQSQSKKYIQLLSSISPYSKLTLVFCFLENRNLYFGTDKGSLYKLENAADVYGNVTAATIGQANCVRQDGVLYATNELFENGMDENRLSGFLTENDIKHSDDYSDIYIHLDAADGGENKYNASIIVFTLNEKASKEIYHYSAKTIVFDGSSDYIKNLTQVELSIQLISTYIEDGCYEYFSQQN